MAKAKQAAPYNKLKGLMARYGFSQVDMAKVADMSPTTFSFKVNRKDGRDFTLTEAVKMADHLGVKVDDFF